MPVNSRSGFTLVEALVCIVIAGVHAVAVMSRLHDNSAHDATLAGSQVIAMARRAAEGHRPPRQRAPARQRG